MEQIPNPDRREEELIAERAAEWLMRLSTATPQERRAFLQWLKESRQHVREVLLATTWDTLLVHLDPKGAIDVHDLIEASSNVMPVRPGAELTPTAPTRQSHPMRRRRGAWMLGISGTAAALVLVVMNLMHPLQFKTAVGEQRAFDLADGSVIHLNTQSDVRVDFSEQLRDVYLDQGQVIFKVKHDPRRPFRVHVGSTVIQAIGTQFDVYRHTDRTNVAVIEGAVQIIAATSSSALVPQPGPGAAASVPERTRLAAGESVSIVGSGQITAPAPVDIVEVNAWQQRRLIFRRHTLKEIAAEFNRYNRRLQIRVEGDELREMRFSGVFDADDPESLLTYLASDGRVLFERDGNELVIRPQPPGPAHAPAPSTGTI